ncbi:MAG: response regulator [Deltaproteobacteria bacterium]|nr:response regulator [Deltaproteobacteria bacterium]
MSEPLRALLLEDVPTDAKLIVRALQADGPAITWERVEDAAGLRRCLAEASWDVILSDWSMPSFDAMAALAIVRERGLDVPFIIVSGTIGEERAAEVMRSGAHDYVLKHNLARLAPAVEREVREAAERRARRAAEGELRRQEARYRRIIETTHEGIWTIDLQGRTSFVNRRMAELCGRAPGDVIGREALELVAPASREVAARRLRPNGPEPEEVDVALERPDGSCAVVVFETMTIHGEDGAPEGVLAMGRDVTAERAAEEARRRAEDALARSDEQLRHAQKMEAIGRLAGGVAHDFNNLLSVILSYASLLADDLGPDDERTTSALEITAAGQRAAQLTRQLLAFSRQQIVEPRLVDLNAIVVSMERMCGRLLGEDVRLATRLDPTIGKVLADPSSLEQVIMNLVVNARDAMPRGGSLTIETARVEVDPDYAGTHLGVSPGPHVQLAVSDSGVGIEPAIVERIFEPFFTTKELGKGTGLGLSTVFGIVKQAGGTIWVYSEVGVGTTFKVLLPRAAAVTLVTPRPAPAVIDLRGREAVLVVEDDGAVRAVAAGILRRHGYTVVEAADPAAALALEPSVPTLDALLTDLVLPGMSGPELARRLRERRPGLRVLCMSGYTDDAVVRHGLIEQGLPFLSKPLVPDALLRKLRELLSS